MANATNSKFWNLDTAGVITKNNVHIINIIVTWKAGSAGELELTEVSSDKGVGNSIIHATTLGAGSAAVNNITQVLPVDNVVRGVNLKTITDVAKCIVNTK